MELEQAIKILKTHNEWRRYDGKIEDTPEMQSPKEIGMAIDKIVNTKLFTLEEMGECYDNGFLYGTLIKD